MPKKRKRFVKPRSLTTQGSADSMNQQCEGNGRSQEEAVGSLETMIQQCDEKDNEASGQPGKYEDTAQRTILTSKDKRGRSIGQGKKNVQNGSNIRGTHFPAKKKARNTFGVLAVRGEYPEEEYLLVQGRFSKAFNKLPYRIFGTDKCKTGMEMEPTEIECLQKLIEILKNSKDSTDVLAKIEREKLDLPLYHNQPFSVALKSKLEASKSAIRDLVILLDTELNNVTANGTEEFSERRWGIPKGARDSNDKDEKESAFREFREEVGEDTLEWDDPWALHEFQYEDCYSKHNTKLFFVDAGEGVPDKTFSMRDSSEISQRKWFTYDSAMELNMGNRKAHSKFPWPKNALDVCHKSVKERRKQMQK